MSESDATNPSETNPSEIKTDVVDAVEAHPTVDEQVKPIAPPPAPPPMPVLVCHSVTARDAAGPKRRARGSLNGISFSLGKGVSAFVGTPEDGTFALVDVLTGARAPLRGRVQVMGAVPERSPSLRMRMGVLSPEPSLPAARSIADVVTMALHARGQTNEQPAKILALLGLEHLGSRSPRSLSFAETRAVELALALSTPSPLFVVLHEPLADVAVNLIGLVRERIHQLGASGACVVITTSSPTDARALADDIFVLHRGTLARDAMAHASAAPDAQSLVAWVRPAEQGDGLAPIRLLAQALTKHPDISSVTWTDRPGVQASELRLSGTNIDACALALADAAVEVGAIVEAIAPPAPLLSRVRAAAEASEAMRRAPLPQRPAGLSGPVPGGPR